VIKSQPMGSKNFFDSGERQIRKMLVVNGIEFVLRNQLHQMGELHRDSSFGLEEDFHAADEIVQIGNMGEDVISHDQIRLDSPRYQLAGRFLAKKFHYGWDSFLNRDFGDIRRRLYAQDFDPLADKIAQQIAIIARDLDDLALPVQAKTFDHHFDIGFGMLEPRFRIGGEIGIVAKNMVGAFKFLELHQEAAFAHINVQRIKALDLIKLRRFQPRLSKGRLTQVYKSMPQYGSTKPTTVLSHRNNHCFLPIISPIFYEPRNKTLSVFQISVPCRNPEAQLRLSCPIRAVASII